MYPVMTPGGSWLIDEEEGRFPAGLPSPVPSVMPSPMPSPTAGPLPQQPNVYSGLDPARIEMLKKMSRTLPVLLETDRLKGNSAFTFQDSAINTLTPEQLAALREQFTQSEEAQAMKEGTDRLAAMVAMEAEQPIQPDLSAAIGWLDQASGSRNLAGYARPEAPQARSKRIMDQMGTVQKGREGYLQRLNDYISKVKGGMDITKLAETTELLKTLSNQDPKKTGSGAKAMSPGQVTNTRRNFVRDFAIREPGAVNGLKHIGPTLKLLEQESSMADASLQRELLKLVGDTRPSDRDVQAFGGNPNLWERAKQFAEKNLGSGAFTPENRQQIRDMIVAMAEEHATRFENAAKIYASGGDLFPGISELPESERLRLIYTGMGEDRKSIQKARSMKAQKDKEAEKNKAPSFADYLKQKRAQKAGK